MDEAPAFHVYRYRMRPMRPEQEVLAMQSMGNSRWVYNQAVALNRDLMRAGKKTLSKIDIINLLPEWKEEHDWLSLGPSQPLQQALMDYGQALTAHFQNPAQNKPPVFKKRDDLNTSLRFPQPKGSDWNAKNGWINLPKFGQLKYFKDGRVPHGTLKQVSLVREGDRWMICLCVEQSIASRQNFKRHTLPEDPRDLTDVDIIGIDLGHVHAATDHLGNHYDFPLERVAQLDERIAHVQAIVAHKHEAGKAFAKHQEKPLKEQQKFLAKSNTVTLVSAKEETTSAKLAKRQDSKRLKNAKACLRKLQMKRQDILNNARHQLSHRLTELAPVVCVEDLKLKKLLENIERKKEETIAAVMTSEADKHSSEKKLSDQFKKDRSTRPMPRAKEKALHRGWACLGGCDHYEPTGIQSCSQGWGVDQS